MIFCDKDLLWLELVHTPEFALRYVPVLFERFGSVEEVFCADLLTLGECEIGSGAANGITARAGREAAEREAEILEREGIGLVSFESEDYPHLLKEISDPPPVLYCRGRLDLAEKPAVAMVGSRQSTAYGEQVAQRLAGDLAARGVAVVSGMARGIDQKAHIGALEAGGRTIAVIGSGLGNIYPPRSEKLVEAIAESGAVISEFPFDTPPSKGTFPQRNRIISGLCHATVVVEAGERSGALITARFALEQNRELLAVPGPISGRMSIATNYMIKKGAKLVQRVDDIIDELPAEARRALMQPTDKGPPPELNDAEAQVLELLSVDTPQHIDIIARLAGMATGDLSLTLLSLEMKSLVRQLPGAEYVRIF
ncbi:MAG TPA: DNA-processing protein DprA [Acidobacteriota bacterium]|nr:DNA-processing protein DprA [Acidobacteriota bacterium]